MLPYNYAYASGKLKALQPLILDPVDIERMVDAPDFVSAFKVLNDTDYADYLLDIEPVNYRDALRRDFMQMHTLLEQIIPDRNLFKLLYLDRDFINLGELYKVKYHGIPLHIDKLSTDTVYPVERLSQMVLHDAHHQGVDADCLAIIAETNATITAKTDPALIDTLLRQILFRWRLALAKRIGNAFVEQYVTTQINNANILTWLRAKRLGLPPDQAFVRLFEGGDASPHALIDLYHKPANALRNYFMNWYDRAVLKTFDQFLEKNLLYELEKSVEDYLTRITRRANWVPYGPEVVVSYYLAKRVAVFNVRLILAGKLNRVPLAEIKQTLREPF